MKSQLERLIAIREKMSIFDIPQPRVYVRCKDTHALVAASPGGYGFSVDDNTQLWFASTNHRLEHNGILDFKVVCADPAGQFPGSLGSSNFACGFVLPVNQCLAPDASAIFYGINSVARNGANDYRIGGRYGAITSGTGNIGIPDSAWPLGVFFRIVVDNRFVQFLIGTTLVGLAPFAVSPYLQGNYIETPSGYVSGGGSLPFTGAKFRWTGGRARLLEMLTPMVLIKTVTTVTILKVTQGEGIDLTVPVQP